MVSTLKPLAILLVWLAPIAAFAQSSPCPTAVSAVQKHETAEENPIKITRVTFTGNPALPSVEQEEISAALSEARFKTQRAAREELKTRVRMQWQQRGYFRVEMGEPEIDPASFVATMRVDAGKQYRLAELRFVKNTVFPSEKLRSLFLMQTGDIFDTHLIGKGMEEVRKLYADNGYINLVMVPTTQMDNGERTDLTVQLDEGQQFRVGRVEVLSPDEAKRMQFVSSSGLISGSIFNGSRLQKAFASSDSDGSEAMVRSVVRSINEGDSTIDFKVDLRPCVSVSQK